MKSPVRRTRTLFFRYALSYTLVVLFLFFGISAFLFNSTGRQVLREKINDQINRLTRIAVQHEGYISRMLATAEEIGLSPRIEPFLYDAEPWKAYDLQLQLVPYTSTNSFCDQIDLVFSEDSRVYSSSAAMSLDQFTSLMRYETVSPEALADALRNTVQLTVLPSQRIRSSLVDSGDLGMVSFLLPLGSSPGARKGTILFLIKESVYQAMFSDAIDAALNTYILSGDTVIAFSEDLAVPAEQAMLPPNAGESTRTFRYGGEDFLSVTTSRRDWGMRYVSVLRMSDINSATRSSRGRVMIILLVLTALSLGFTVWLSRRHARPIEELSGLLPVSDASRKDELQHLSTGIRQLATRNSELASRLEQALPLQRHDFVLRFMRGRFSSAGEAVSLAASLGLNIRYPCYAVILCSVPEDWDTPFELTGPPFDSLTDWTCAGVELVAIKANLYLVFAAAAESVFALARMLHDRGGGVTSVSAPHTRFDEAPAAYLEAAAAYENRFVMGTQSVLAYESLSSNIAEFLPQARKMTTAISQALSLGNRDLLNDRIAELLRFLKNTNMSPFAFRMIYNDVLDTLTRDQADAVYDRSSAREFYDIFSLSSCQSIDDLDDLLRRLCDSLISRRTEDSLPVPEEPDEIDQAADYMRSHYSDPEISMAAIAESLGLSTTRLSMSFKERKGMSPSDYLTLLRCERARELLETTDLTIRDISVQVGYYDSGSFIRRFKQVTGVTPLQYRRQKSGPSAQ